MSVTVSKHNGGHLLVAEIRLPGRRAAIFDFFSDAYNLQELTPPYLQFEILTPKPIDMNAGTLIDYRLRVRGVPIRWRTEISAWEPPFRFVDEQLRGPYRYWVHEHTFTEDAGATLIRDRVHYKAPLSFLTHPLLVSRDVRDIFEYRSNVLKKRYSVG